MDDRSQEMLRELAGWQPRHGVISVCLDVDPADRGNGWRIELDHGLKRIVDERLLDAPEPDIVAAAKRIRARFPGDGPHRSGRTQVGFVEVGGEGRAVWNGFQASLGTSLLLHDRTARLTELVRLLERGAPVGVVLLAAEHARVFEWAQGRLGEEGDWELEVASYDWRERRSPRRNPAATGTGTTASGRDQHEQRLASSRARFLKELGGILETRFGDRGWRRIVVFGEGELPSLMQAGLGASRGSVREVHRDLIRAGAAELSEHVEAEVAAINLERERELLERIEEAIGSEAGAASGPGEVLGALEQGRVSHLIFDPSREFDVGDGRDGTEVLINLGLATGAAITPLEEDDSAARLARRDGAVALLRY